MDAPVIVAHFFFLNDLFLKLIKVPCITQFAKNNIKSLTFPLLTLQKCSSTKAILREE